MIGIKQLAFSALRTVTPWNFSLGVCGEGVPLYPSPFKAAAWGDTATTQYKTKFKTAGLINKYLDSNVMQWEF